MSASSGCDGVRVVSVNAERAHAMQTPRTSAPPPQPDRDAESSALLAGLRRTGAERDRARLDLHALLLRAARFEVRRREPGLPHLRGDDMDDLAQQSADDALVAVLRKLDDFRGESRFTTWAYKFALLEAAVKLRRRAWQGREVPLESERWDVLADQGSGPVADAETNELVDAIRDAIKDDLTPHQREILVAITLDGVPIDVLAERLATNRGALYKTLHDARRKLRLVLAEKDLPLEAR